MIQNLVFDLIPSFATRLLTYNMRCKASHTACFHSLHAHRRCFDVVGRYVKCASHSPKTIPNTSRYHTPFSHQNETA